MGEEQCIEYQNQEGYRSLGKMIQGAVWDTVWARRLVALETPDGLLDLVSVGFAGRGQEVKP